jgi:hypothetical protein
MPLWSGSSRKRPPLSSEARIEPEQDAPQSEPYLLPLEREVADLLAGCSPSELARLKIFTAWWRGHQQRREEAAQKR